MAAAGNSAASRGAAFLLHVQIRSALPGILTGMRICMAASWTSIVAVELIVCADQRPRLPDPQADYLGTMPWCSPGSS